MADGQNVVSIKSRPAAAEAETRTGKQEPYDFARVRLTRFLVRRCLVDSYFSFKLHNSPYPYVSKLALLPGVAAATHEHVHQRTGFMILLDGVLPANLNKHFRLRNSNRVSWRNIRRLAPSVDVTNFKAAFCLLNSPDCETLLEQLLGLDYALLIDRNSDDAKQPASPCRLSHMHVKVERLTDSAIKDLGKSLGYIDRRLFERGEDYVDELEARFFEFFGFSPNASGRKSAAAMAAQLLAKHGPGFSVFAANQDDCRLTVLDDSDSVTQYMLVRLDAEEAGRLSVAAKTQDIDDLSPYILDRGADGEPVVLLKVRLERTKAARPVVRAPKDRLLSDPWLKIAHQAVFAVPLQNAPPATGIEIDFEWAGEL